MNKLTHKLWAKILAVVIFYISAIVFCFSAAMLAYMLDGRLSVPDYNSYSAEVIEQEYVYKISEEVYFLYLNGALGMEVTHNDAPVYYRVQVNGTDIGGTYEGEDYTRQVHPNMNFSVSETKYAVGDVIPFSVNVIDMLAYYEAYMADGELNELETLPDDAQIVGEAESTTPNAEIEPGYIEVVDGVVLPIGEILLGANNEVFQVNEYGFLEVLEVGEPQILDITLYFTESILLPSEYAEIEAQFTVDDIAVPIIENAVPIAIISFVVATFTFVFLLVGAGRKAGAEGVHLNSFDKIPFDILLIIFLLPTFVGLSSYSFGPIIISLVLLLPLLVTFTVRMKARHWWKNTLIFIIPNFFWHLLKNGALKAPLILKFMAVLIPLFFIQFIMYSASDGFIEFFTLVWSSLVVGVLFTLVAIWVNKIKKASQNLAQGDFEQKIDVSMMMLEFKEIGENFNKINDGMNIAVEEKMKSEKLKTELITNVSHDIKTPLTSIINYVDLIKKEDVQNEKIAEYTEVLDRQSQKLKRLIADLVDASKISTGNVEIKLEPVDMCVFAEQILGEYSSKLEEAKLDIVVNFPSEPMIVLADSKHLQRVFDNIMINAIKYSLAGTRVYLDVIKHENAVAIVLKNTSKEKLNISSSELMERFVRGDSSRNTDGNGLGLSIAQSLTKAQNGDFDILIDGDLFKVIITFWEVE